MPESDARSVVLTVCLSELIPPTRVSIFVLSNRRESLSWRSRPKGHKTAICLCSERSDLSPLLSVPRPADEHHFFFLFRLRAHSKRVDYPGACNWKCSLLYWSGQQQQKTCVCLLAWVRVCVFVCDTTTTPRRTRGYLTRCFSGCRYSQAGWSSLQSECSCESRV